MVRTPRGPLDRIASSTRNAHLAPEVIVGDEIVAARRLRARRADPRRTSRPTTRSRTSPDGWSRSARGDVLAGTLGTRRALRGYAGDVPAHIAVGDTIDVLNLGGILGRCTSANPDIGPPFKAEVLGAVLDFPGSGRPDRPPRAHPGRRRSRRPTRSNAPPVVYVAGTCMNAGKTVAATELVRGLTRGGPPGRGAKLTGVSLMRDALSMLDAGAIAALTFNDAGIASTHAGMTVPVAQGCFNRLAGSSTRPTSSWPSWATESWANTGCRTSSRDPRADGRSARRTSWPRPIRWPAGAPTSSCAHQFGLAITVLTGPATDNEVGRDYIDGAARPPGAQRAAGCGWPAGHDRARSSDCVAGAANGERRGLRCASP